MTTERQTYDLTFVSRSPSWSKRRGQRCRLLRMVGHRRCEVEFADGTGPVRVHVLAVHPSPLYEPEEACTTDATPARRDAVPDGRTEDAIQASGHERFRALGYRVYNLSQKRPSKQGKGLGDSYVIGYGVCCWVEWKAGRNKQTDDQREFGEAVLANGGHYCVAYSEAEAVAYVEGLRRER